MRSKNILQIALAMEIILCGIELIVICINPFSDTVQYLGICIGIIGIIVIPWMFLYPPKNNEKTKEVEVKTDVKETETKDIIENGLHSAFATITLDDGVFDVIAKGGPRDDYPGVDVEFIRPDFNGTNPRVLFELTPENELRCLIWANPDQEDYSRKISFGTISPHDAKENISDDGNTAR